MKTGLIMILAGLAIIAAGLSAGGCAGRTVEIRVSDTVGLGTSNPQGTLEIRGEGEGCLLRDGPPPIYTAGEVIDALTDQVISLGKKLRDCEIKARKIWKRLLRERELRAIEAEALTK